MFQLLYFYCRRESYGYPFSVSPDGDSTGDPSDFNSCDTSTILSYSLYLVTLTAADSNPRSSGR